MSMEKELRAALRREAPPAGFAQRVMERIEAEAAAPQPGPSTGHRGGAPWWWGAVAAAVLGLMVAGNWQVNEYREQQAGEFAAQQVMLAMRIASEKIYYAQQEVRAIGAAN